MHRPWAYNTYSTVSDNRLSTPNCLDKWLLFWFRWLQIQSQGIQILLWGTTPLDLYFSHCEPTAEILDPPLQNPVSAPERGESCRIVFGPCLNLSYISVVRLLKYLYLYRLVIAGKVPAMHAHGYCTMRRRVLANSHAWIVEWEWECTADTPVVGGARCSSTPSPGLMAINSIVTPDLK